MDYMYNTDSRRGTLSYNQVLDLTDVEPSGDAPAEPVTLQEAKDFCKIDGDDDDLIIDMLITACRIECEELSNIGFINRDVVLVQNNGNGGAYLPLGPNGDISLIEDADGNEIKSDNYTISGTAYKQLISPCGERLTIYYNTGHTALPANLKLALLECIFYRYDERKGREVTPVYLDLIKQVARIW
jgi:hypothetical protein